MLSDQDHDEEGEDAAGGAVTVQHEEDAHEDEEDVFGYTSLEM